VAIQTDQKGRQELTRIVGARLRASRIAARLSMGAAASKLRHKGITQVSLAEDGKRLPPLLDLLKYADLYCVPVDFLLGRIDDPIAETSEHAQGLMVRSVTHSMGPLFAKLTEALASNVAVSLSGLREDRGDLTDVIQLAGEIEQTMDRMRQLNPEFDDLRGGSKLLLLTSQMASIGRRVESRIRNERIQYEMIDRALDVEEAEERVKQLHLNFDVRLPTQELAAEAVESEAELVV